jgi:hypothetical protein
MKLADIKIIKEADEITSTGTYAAVKFDNETKKAITDYITSNGIQNGVNPEKLHCTLLYSRKYLPDYEPLGDIDPPWIGTAKSFDVWDSSDKTSRCLVLEFECPELQERHKTLMDQHEATYDFPEYKTHVTLSYNIGDLDHTALPPFEEQLTIVSEYGEDLDLDWNKSSTSDD